MNRSQPPKAPEPAPPRRGPNWPLQPLSLIAYLAVGVGLGMLALRWQVAESLKPGQGLLWADFTTPAWTIAIGILTNVSCALLGCYLVLRRMSLLGDAISHSVLLGLAIAFVLTGRLTGWPMFLGAMAMGVLTCVLTQAISSVGKVSEDTSMGVVFTSLFALGVILIMSQAKKAHIDAECILYGQIEYAAVDLPAEGTLQIPRSIWFLTATVLATLAFVLVLWKELKIVSFDPALAAAMGLSVPVVHYTLMTMVACVSVSAFEAVGSILVVAMLIVPAATAALVTDRLSWMLAWAATFGVVSAIFGYVLAAATATSVAGMMAVVAGIQLTGAIFIGPHYGLLARWLRNLSLAVRIASEDVIARLYREEESGSRSPDRAATSHESAVVRWLASLRLARENWVLADRQGALKLTDDGRTAARNLVRAHRLWETYLDTHFDLPRDHLHDAAERMEHFLDPELQAELDAELAGVATDPHGKEIPPAK